MTGYLQRLPPETLEAILLHIDHPHDLLCIALTNHFFCERIIPEHIQFRHIRCTSYHPKLWLKLTERRALAIRIKCIEIVPKYPDDWYSTRSIIPSFFTVEDTKEDAERIMSPQIFSEALHQTIERFSTALNTMKYLRRFALCEYLDIIDLDKLLAALAISCPQLQSLQIMLNLPKKSLVNEQHSMPLQCFIGHFTGLLQISLGFGPEDEDVHEGCSREITNFLKSLSNLEDIHLVAKTKQAVKIPIILQDPWPNLKRIAIESGIDILEGSTDSAHSFNQFFHRHRKIEAVEMTQMVLSPGSIPSDILHHLQCLSLKICFSSIDLWSDTNIIPLDVIIRLEFLQTRWDWIDTRAMMSESFQMTSLRHCIISLDDMPLLQLLWLAPNLERLLLSHYRGSNFKEDQAFVAFENDILALHKMEYLTHLGGFLSNIIVNPPNEPKGLPPHGNEYLASLASGNRTLRYVQICYEDIASSWVRIRRNADGSYEGFELCECLETIDHRTWAYFDDFVSKPIPNNTSMDVH